MYIQPSGPISHLLSICLRTTRCVSHTTHLQLHLQPLQAQRSQSIGSPAHSCCDPSVTSPVLSGAPLASRPQREEEIDMVPRWIIRHLTAHTHSSRQTDSLVLSFKGAVGGHSALGTRCTSSSEHFALDTILIYSFRLSAFAFAFFPCNSQPDLEDLK